MADEGVRSAHQVQAEGPNHEIRNFKVNEKGELLVKSSDSGTVTGEKATTLTALNQAFGATPTAVTLNADVDAISVANLSSTETDTITVSSAADGITLLVPAGLAVEFPINKTLASISIIGTGADTDSTVSGYVLVTGKATTAQD